MYISSFTDETPDRSSGSLDRVLKETICSFVRSQVLFVAVRLNLFTIIAEAPMGSLTHEEMPSSQVSPSLLAYLVYLRLLKRCPNSTRYECTPVARTYLVSSQPNYVGLGLGVWDHRRQYTFFLRLHETLQKGIRTSEQSKDDPCLWTIFEQQHDPMIYFARIMSSFTRCTVSELCDRADFSSYSTLLDIGGSLADLSRTILQRCPHMTALSFDLPELTRYAASLPVDHSNLDYIAGDFFDEQWPDEIVERTRQIDLVSLKYILHDWSPPRREFLVEKIYKLLQRKMELAGGNGTLLVIEKMIDRERRNITSLSTSISMAVECGDGIGYDGTQQEYEQLLTQVGFQRIQAIHLTGPMVALFARVM